LRVEQVRPEEAWFDHGDLDAELLHFGRDRQRKTFDGKLRRTISRAVLQPNHAGDRTDVDDVTRTLPPHDWQRRLHHMYDTVKVRCELLLDPGGGHLLEITEQTVARIVDQNVNAPEALRRLIDRRFGLGLVGDV